MRASALTWSLASCLSHAHDSDGDHHHSHRHLEQPAPPHVHDERCATREPTLRDELLEQVRLQTFAGDNNNARRHLVTASCEELCDQCIEIETHLHLIEADIGFGAFIPHPTDTVARLLSDPTSVSPAEFTTPAEMIALFESNMAVVNDAFRGTPFRFRFDAATSTTRTVNNEWSNDAVDFQADMSRDVGVGDLQVLDVFWAFNLQSTDSGTILGIASLPAAQINGEGDSYVYYRPLSAALRAVF
jgi:hypothetical protein